MEIPNYRPKYCLTFPARGKDYTSDVIEPACRGDGSHCGQKLLQAHRTGISLSQRRQTWRHQKVFSIRSSQIILPTSYHRFTLLCQSFFYGGLKRTAMSEQRAWHYMATRKRVTQAMPVHLITCSLCFYKPLKAVIPHPRAHQIWQPVTD